MKNYTLQNMCLKICSLRRKKSPATLKLKEATTTYVLNLGGGSPTI